MHVLFQFTHWLTELQLVCEKDEGFCEIPHTTVPQLFSEFAQ